MHYLLKKTFVIWWVPPKKTFVIWWVSPT